MTYEKKCSSPSPSGKWCILKLGHEGPHEDEDEIIWSETYDACGVTLILELNKLFAKDKIDMSPEISKKYGDLFREVAGDLSYGDCNDCKYKDEDRPQRVPWADLD